MADITSLLAALAGGGQGYLQTKERQRVRAQEADADAARRLAQSIAMAQSGVRTLDQVGQSLPTELSARLPGVGEIGHPYAGQEPQEPDTPELRALGPRYVPVDDTHVIDQYATPAIQALRVAALQRAQADQRTAADRTRKAGIYQAAGLRPEQAAAVVEDPSLGTAFFKPPASQNVQWDTKETRSGEYVQVNPVTGQTRKIGLFAPPHRDPNAVGTGEQKPTEFSNKAALLYPRAVEAAKNLDRFFTRGAPVRSMMQKVPGVGNFLVNDDEQAMNQAAEAVSAAILRLESGAAISESEVKSYAKQFLPQPGDSPEVLDQKRTMLQTQLEGMRRAAAPSLDRQGFVPTDAHQNPWRR